MIHETINKDLINVVGVDRIRFITDIETISVNTFIANKGYITYSCNGDNKYTVANADDNNNISFDSLRYKVEFSTFNKTSDRTIYEVKTISHNSHRRIAVDVVLGRYKYDTKHNAYVVNAEEVKVLMEQLHGELIEKGLALKSPNTWTISYIELNKTIKSDNTLEYYDKALTWLVNKVYKSTEEDIYVDNSKSRINKVEAFTYLFDWSQNHKEIIYDKSEQIKQRLSIVLDGNLIRFESKYSDIEIMNTFKTYNAYEILASNKRLEKLFNGSVQRLSDIVNKEVETKVKYYYEKLENITLTEINELYQCNVSQIFDIVFLLEGVRQRYVDVSSKNMSRDIKTFMETKNKDKRYCGNYESVVDILTAFYPKVKIYKFKKSVMKYSTKNNANN